MMKKILYLAGVVVLATGLIACSSPEEKAADYVANANALIQEGKLKKAEIEFRNALQINQNLPDAWYGIARIHERKQEWRQAYGALNKIREVSPKHLGGRIMLGQILLASNQIDQALNDAKEILEMAPGDARAHSLMAAVQYRLGNNAGAQQEVEQALAIDPANNEALLVSARVMIAEKKYDEAIALLDKSIAASPDNVSLYLMKIQAYGETKDKKAVEGVYRSLVKQFPENSAFKTALAQQYISDKNIDGAERLLEQIIQANPDDVDHKLRLVGFKHQYRSLDDAVALLKTYIDSSKEEYRYHYLLGEIYERNKQPDQALKVYQGIVTDNGLQASGLEARNKIALIELRAGNRDKALALVNEVLAQDKNNENGLLLQAGFYIADRKFDDAVVSARTVLRDNPDSIKALGLLGQAYGASGSRDLAIESFTKAFRLSPGTAVIANQLAGVYIRERNYAQANELLQESMSAGNSSVDAVKLFAQVKLALGEWDKAEELAKQLKNIEGQEALSQQVLGVVYQGKEQQGASIDAFKRAHELAPESAQPIVALVQTYVRSGKVDDARRFLNSVLSVHSDNATAYLLLGQLSLYEKKKPEAIKHFNKIIEINPKSDSGYLSLVPIYVRDNDLDGAEAVIKQGLSAIPGRPILVMNLASIYEKKLDFKRAIETYESLLAIDPNLLVAKNNLASLLTDHGGDQASLDKARVVSADFRSSQIPQFRDTYAWASVRAGTNLEEAVALLEGIVKDNEQVGVYNYHLGEAYRKKGDATKAKTYLDSAVKLSGADSDVGKSAKESLRLLK